MAAGLLAPGTPWGSTVGLLQFRGNPQHTFHGTGPMPEAPVVRWSYPDSRMCHRDATDKLWCGSGWTGQPAVWERPDGVTELVVGTYDRHVHFVDVATGRATRPPFETGDIIKGSVTIDPDEYPLVYTGSRDNHLRILALDRGEDGHGAAVELWRQEASADGVWNNVVKLK